VAWLEPYPDVLLDGFADLAPGPEARYEAREAILTHDVWVRMPPLPMEYHGRELATGFFAWAFHGGRRFRLIPTRANWQPAFGLYLRDSRAAIARANGLLVLALAGHQISAITRFEPGVLPQFGLPRRLPD
jgi:RNA polymerase sigma-70 factor, ECF subfamily